MNRRERDYWRNLARQRQLQAARLHVGAESCRDAAAPAAAEGEAALAERLLGMARTAQERASIESQHARLYLFQLVGEG